MKKVIEIITTRRSIRKWKSKEVPKTIIKDLVAAAKSAPSAFNSNSTELIIVEDKKLIDRLLSDRLQMKKPPYYINSMNGL